MCLRLMSVVVSLGLLGLGRSTASHRQEEYDEEMRSKYVDPVENFPGKMDQLLDALNRVSNSILLPSCRPEVPFLISVGVHRSARPSNWFEHSPSKRLKDSCFRCCAYVTSLDVCSNQCSLLVYLPEHESFIGMNDARAKPHTESRSNKSLAA